MNHWVGIGRLTADVTLRYTPNGHAVATFTIAIDRQHKQGEEKQTDFIMVVCWNKLAESCANHIGKGRLVSIEGPLQIRSYEDKDGIKRKVAEIIANTVEFLDWPKNEGE